MCGLIGGYALHPQRVKGHVLNIYEKQKTRGTQGYGVGVRKRDGSMYRVRGRVKEDVFNSDIWSYIESGDYFIFHHRYPTSTPNEPECNHPICNEDGTLMLAHNGVLSDAKEERDDHVYETEILSTHVILSSDRKIGYTSCVTDSEFAVHYLEELVDNNEFEDALKKLGEAYGASAYLLLMSEFDGLIYVGKNHPLWFYRYGGNYYMSSLKTIITSDKYLKDNCVDLDPAYGWLCGRELHRVHRPWDVTYTPSNRVSDSYTEWNKAREKGETNQPYTVWLQERNTQVKQLPPANNNETFVRFLPDDVSLQDHLKKYPNCHGRCDDCREYHCYNNPASWGAEEFGFFSC